MNYFMSLDPLALFRSMPGAFAQGMVWGLMALGVYITYRVEEGLPEFPVTEYRKGLAQVLNNFTRNALKFTEKGSVTIGFRRIPGHIRFYVRDTGIGIAPEDRERIFERFVKLDTFTQGTGLGLSICKSIAEQLGGSVGVDSVAGEGSCFRIDIPAGE